MKYLYGTLIKDDLINIDEPFNLTKDFLTEDLFQLSYTYKNNSLVLDVGWYNKEQGDCFSICIIENEDWMNPVYIKDVFIIDELCSSFYYALGKFDSIIEQRWVKK